MSCFKIQITLRHSKLPISITMIKVFAQYNNRCTSVLMVTQQGIDFYVRISHAALQQIFQNPFTINELHLSKQIQLLETP